MTEIQVITSDSRIWNANQLISELWQSVGTDKPLVVDLCSEGPCCRSCGLDDILHDFVQRSGLCPDSLEIRTCNQLSSSRFRQTRNGFVELDLSQRLAAAISSGQGTMTNKFGMFIGRSNWKRLGLASYLWRHHGRTSVMSYHFDPGLDFFRDNFGLEQYLYENWLDRDVCDFLQHLPMKFEQHDYPIVWDGRAFDLDHHYQDFFCEIVCETFFTGDTFFVTEKTWRPIMQKRPFVVQGPRWYLENLRRLGFRTFADWWSEGYDEDINGGTLDSIKNCIDFIAAQDHSTVLRWYQEMLPVLEHNSRVLQDLTNQKILNTEFKYHDD